MQTEVAGLSDAAGGAHDAPSRTAALEAVARTQAESLRNWIALWQEMWERAAATRNLVELALLPSLMLPEFALQAMLYCKRLSEITASSATTYVLGIPTTAAGIDQSAATVGTQKQASRSPKSPIRSLPFRGE